MTQDGQPFPEFAFLYAIPLNSSLIKSLLFFFDGVAVVASKQRIAQAIQEEPEFFLPFLQSQMSRTWMPEDFFDDVFRTAYRAEVQSLLSSGWFDNRPRNIVTDQYWFPNQFPALPPNWDVLQTQDEVARFRDRLIGPGLNEATAQASSGSLLDELMQRGLVEVRQYVPMSGFQPGNPKLVGTPSTVPEVTRFTAGILGTPFGPDASSSHVLALDETFKQVNDALISQFARSRAGHRFGMVLGPVNASEASLAQLLDVWRSTQQKATIGNVILQDLEVVGLVNKNISLEEIVQFREKHGQAHREYMRELRSFVRDMSQVSLGKQVNELHDRRRKLSDRARELSQISRSTLKSGARFLMGITGAAINFFAGNVPGAGVGIANTLLGLEGSKDKVDALTYLCHIARI